MLKWLSENWGTLVVSLILVAVITLIIIYRIKAKKRGESSCGCDCSKCGSCNACHHKPSGENK